MPFLFVTGLSLALGRQTPYWYDEGDAEKGWCEACIRKEQMEGFSKVQLIHLRSGVPCLPGAKMLVEYLSVPAAKTS